MYIINGEVQNESIINLDNGFFFGYGVFETILLKGTIPILLKEHLTRLNGSLKKLFIDKCITEEYVLKMISKGHYSDCALKIAVSETNIIITDRKILYKEENYRNGFDVNISNLKRNPYSHTTYIKSLNYYDNLIEKKSSTENGYDEVLFLNTAGKIAEGSTTNLFFIKNNKLCTPKIQCGILPGIIRRYIIDILKEIYIVEEGEYVLEDIYNSEGAFLTNSLLGVIRINTIDKKFIIKNNEIDKIREIYMKSLGL
ncbi:aminotransferase class IV [Hathewaya histolytica]|uniref:aminotransferase class IV n=1 Tax=Hathewaya histolytica TaxID=1498 RepID=UPI003B67AB7B